MTALQILKELNSKNIELSLCDGLLKYTAQKGIMTDETISLLREHKAELIEALRAKQATPAITVQKMDVCLHGSRCEFISLVDDRQICRKNNQPIFNMAACLDRKWWKAKDGDSVEANTVQPVYCYCCGGQTFWREKDNTDARWICEVCHPPMPTRDEIEFLQ